MEKRAFSKKSYDHAIRVCKAALYARMTDLGRFNGERQLLNNWTQSDRNFYARTFDRAMREIGAT